MPNLPTRISHCSFRIAALSAVLLTAPFAKAQSVPADSTEKAPSNGKIKGTKANRKSAPPIETSDKKSADSAEGDSITLSPFEVNTDKDNGFAANSAGTGGRLNMKMEDVPAPFSAMTRDFIDALGITNLVQASTWATNGAPIFDGQGVDMFGNPNLVNIRGQGTSQSGQRNYSFTASILDSYNLERYEFGRGPNGALFNISNGNSDNPLVGGQSATTKRARLDRPFTTIASAVGSWDYYRTTLDVNYPLTDKLAVRGNAVWYDRNGWRLNEFEKTKGLTLASVYQPSRQNEFRMEASAEETNRSQPTTLVTEKLSGWDGKTVFNGPVTDAIYGANNATQTFNGLGQPLTFHGNTQGVDRRAGSYYVWVPGQRSIENRQNEGVTLRGNENAQVPLYSGGVANFQGSGLPFGNGGSNASSSGIGGANGDDIWFLGEQNLPADRFNNAIVNSGFRMPTRRFTYLPNFPVFEQHNKDFNMAFTHEFTKTFIAEVGVDFNRTHDARMQDLNTPRVTRIDINQNMPDGSPNPYFLQPYGDLRGRLADRYTTTGMARLNLAWLKDLGAWGDYHLTLNASTNKTSVKDRDHILSAATASDPRVWNSGNQAVYYRYYWNNPARPYDNPDALPTAVTGPTFTTGNIVGSSAASQVKPRWVLNGWGDTARLNSTISLPSTASFFHNKLIFTLAPRFDKFRTTVKNSPDFADLPSTWDANTLIFKPAAPANWSNLTYVLKNNTTGVPVTGVPTLALARPRVATSYANVSNTSINLNQRRAVYADDVFRDDFSAPDNSGHKYIGSYGFVYHALPWLSPYANYATNYALPPVNTYTINSDQVAARVGYGYDGGLRFSFLGGKLTLNANYFYDTADHERVTSPIVGSANSLLGRQTAFDPLSNGHARGIANFYTNDYQTRWVKGYELELAGQITNGWRVTLNAGSNKSAAKDQYPLSRTWLKIWDPSLQVVLGDAGGMLTGGPQATGAPGLAVANPAITPTSITARDNAVTDYNNVWANYANTVQLVGRQNIITYIRANFFTDYTIQTGRFKGLRGGFGAQYRGGWRANVAGNKNGQSIVNALGVAVDDPTVDQYNNVFVYQPMATYATLGYSMKLGKRNLAFQLNINNLFDTRSVVYQDSGVSLRPPGGDLSNPNRVAVASRVADYAQPISFIFTTTLKL